MGSGRSAFTREPFQHHEDLYELLRHLGVDRAHLVGLSLGARIALDLCLEHPEVARCLVLSGPGVSGFKWTPDRRMLPMIEAIGANDLIGAADRWLEHPYMAPAMELPHVRARLRTLARENSHIYSKLPNAEIELEPPAIDRLSEISVPTLLLMGTRDVADIQTIADLLTSEIADLTRIDFEDAGHVLNMEQPERFTREVLDFLGELQRCDQFGAMPESLNHRVGVSGDQAELVPGGHRHRSGEITPADAFQNIGLIGKQQPQIPGI